MRVKPPHKFLVEKIKVYPTQKPEAAKEVETPPQTVKLQAITRSMLERAWKR